MHQKDISRGKENAISKLEFLENKSTREIDRTRILMLIDSRRNTHEIAEILNKQIYQISGRFTELKKEGIIKDIGFCFFNGKRGTIYARI